MTINGSGTAAPACTFDGNAIAGHEFPEAGPVRDSELVEQPTTRNLPETWMDIEDLHHVGVRNVDAIQDPADGTGRGQPGRLGHLTTPVRDHLDRPGLQFHVSIVVVPPVARPSHAWARR